MKTRHFLLVILLLSTACQAATPPAPVTASVGAEFSLTPGQSATLETTGLTIKLIAVPQDARCPSAILCAASGPVSLSISVQQAAREPVEFALQTFTSSDGRAPTMEFEGIVDRVEYAGLLIRVVAVLPYPLQSAEEIAAPEYRVIFVATVE